MSSSFREAAALDSSGRLGILGIGLVTEELGKGARLVFRYPSSPPPYFLPNLSSDKYSSKETHKNCNTMTGEKSVQKKSEREGNVDLFFDLPSRVISKLFRPKRPLCGQPLSLRVGGTTFCCRAESLDSPQHSSRVGGQGSDNPLVLFCVIVAMAPFKPLLPIGGELIIQPHPNHAAVAFDTIRCVQRNLVRLCRVLTREEFRCGYLSLQCNMLLQIRRDYELRISQELGRSNGAGGGLTNASSAPDMIAPSQGDVILSPPPIREEKGIASTPPTSSESAKEFKHLKSSVSVLSIDMESPTMTQMQRRKCVQNLIDIMLSSISPDNDKIGNLAIELKNVFHCLSSQLLTATARNQIVNVNRHIAVPMGSVTDHLLYPTHYRAIIGSQPKQYFVKPYQTLLFPALSSFEVLEDLKEEIEGAEMIASYSTPLSLCYILPHVQPHKSLQEMAHDTSIPLARVLDAANWLVLFGTCTTALPVLPRNRYTCAGGIVMKISQWALPFWQAFGTLSKDYTFHWVGGHDTSCRTGIITRTVTTGVPHIFAIVSALTTKPSCRSSLSSSLSDVINSLSGADVLATHIETFNKTPFWGEKNQNQRSCASALFEEIIYSMTFWLIANSIIVDVNDYLVASELFQCHQKGSNLDFSLELLYQELLQAGSLDGALSVSAISYEFGIELSQMEKFIKWGLLTKRLHVLSGI